MPRTFQRKMKRPSFFFGIPRQFIDPAESPAASAVDEAAPLAQVPDELLNPVETACTKKLAISPRCPSFSGPCGHLISISHPSYGRAGESDSPEYEFEMKGYRLVNCERFSQAVNKIGVCCVCLFPLTVKEDLVSRRGLVTKLLISCSNTACNNEAAVCDPYLPESKSLNARLIFAARQFGKGRANLDFFCAYMGMLPPVSSGSFSIHTHCLASVAMGEVSKLMQAASAHLHELHDVGPTVVIDITVTCDGTCSKRGFTGMHGVVSVISWEAGQVVDFQIIMKRCPVCTHQKTVLGDDDSDEYVEWWERTKHKERCQINHFGSSSSKECAAVVEIWKRSEKKCT